MIHHKCEKRSTTSLCPLIIFPKALFGWGMGNLGIENGGMEKWTDKKDLVFLYVCLVGGWKIQSMKNLFA